MAQSTKLTQQDLNIYRSERLTDTPDGGGMMQAVALTGADNELFAPVSDVDRTVGSFDARLVYPAVLRDDTEPLYGAHVIIAEPPTTANVSFLAVKAGNYGEERKDILPRIEAYSVPTIESHMTLLGKQLRGTRLVQAYQRVEAALPKVGERYCLQQGTRYEYFRIINLSDEVRTFETADGKTFQRRVVKMEASGGLTADFDGTAYPDPRYANPHAKILETQVADTAQYYGVRPLAEDITQGSASLAVDTLYEQLVPTSTVETAYVDQYPVGSNLWVQVGGESAVIHGVSAYGDAKTFYLPRSVMPGTVTVTRDGGGLIAKDDGRGFLHGTPNGTIDYANGVLYFDSGSIGNSITVTAVPAVYFANANYTAVINIDDTNQGTEWAPFLKPRPARGSVSVSFLAMGNWYVLTDKGDGVLRDQKGEGRGQVTPDGSLVISLPALPDVGSKIVIGWSPLDFYRTVDDKDAGSLITPKNQAVGLSLLAAPLPNIKPSTVQLTVTTGSGSKTVQDNGQGLLTGDMTGKIDYAAGTMTLDDATGATAINVSLQRYTAESTLKTITLEEDATRIYGVMGAVTPGSVFIAAEVKYVQSGGTQAMRTISYTFAGSTFAYTFPDAGKYHPAGSSQTQNTMLFTDNGAGGLLKDGKPVAGATVDYTSGMFFIPKEPLGAQCAKPSYVQHQIATGAQTIDVHGGFTVVSAEVKAGGKAYVRVLADKTLQSVTQTVNTGLYEFDVLQDKPLPRMAILSSWAFEIDGIPTIERGGVLYQNWDGRTGEGTQVGALNPLTGMVSINHPKLTVRAIKVTAGIYLSGVYDIKQYYGRTAAAPVKPQSFTVRAEGDAGTLVGRADAEGRLTGELSGTIDTETGLYTVHVTSDTRFAPESLRYNAVAQANVPLDSSIIGIDAVRLPPDGRVPVFRRGDMIVIGHRAKESLGSAVTAGQSVSLSRNDLDRVCLMDADGKHVNAEMYRVDLAAGKITFADPLDLSAYKMPLTAHTAREEENRIINVDISGRLKLQFPTKRAYPKVGTYVSSALIGGDLQVRATVPFSEQAWKKIWADERQTDDILARVNVKDYPFVLTSAGAISERWLILFKSAQQFQLFGEHLGLVLEADILTDLAPPNPATNKPYFTLPRLAFGGGWAAGNCIRFNTYGTQIPTWVLRAVTPSPDKQTERDGFTVCLRGNTIDG